MIRTPHIPVMLNEVLSALAPEDGKTYDQYMDDGYLEHYSHRYTSKSGDKIVVFGRYGYDG